MTISNIRPMLLATAFALAGCGGGGGVASIPPPPSLTPDFPNVSTDQQFAVMGAVHTDAAGQPALLDSSDQLQVRYVASSGTYEVQMTGDPWTKVTYDGDGSWTSGIYNLWLKSGDYDYSRLLSYFDGATGGNQAIGLATPAGGVPLTGSATYAGDLLGQTSENHPDGSNLGVEGSIHLSFDFGGGSLSGSITPDLHQGYDLGTIDFTNTVYSAGSTTFSGKFDTDGTGVNSFSGLFTGPAAQELIGNFAFPYKSPIDGLSYQADGAFVGKK
jgi:hypothetical protein